MIITGSQVFLLLFLPIMALVDADQTKALFVSSIWRQLLRFDLLSSSLCGFEGGNTFVNLPHINSGVLWRLQRRDPPLDRLALARAQFGIVQGRQSHRQLEHLEVVVRIGRVPDIGEGRDNGLG
jgi:hypothetical protein